MFLMFAFFAACERGGGDEEGWLATLDMQDREEMKRKSGYEACDILSISSRWALLLAIDYGVLLRIYGDGSGCISVLYRRYKPSLFLGGPPSMNTFSLLLHLAYSLPSNELHDRDLGCSVDAQIYATIL